MVFGVDPMSLSPQFPTIPFAKAMDDAMQAVLLRHLPSPWWKSMRWLRIGKERKLAEAKKVIDHFVAENILKKMEGDQCSRNNKSLDLLTTYIIDSKDRKDDKFLRDTTVNLMLAGGDGNGTALSWFFWLLAMHPQVKSKILEELREHEDIARLVYCHAALMECMRLYPPIPLEHKAALRPEVLPSGHPVRAGTKILFSTYAMGRMEGVWGKDCLEFKPERWISERGTLRHEPSYKFLAFNCGPRSCLGKEIAFMTMKTAAAAVMRNFDVELVEGQVVEPKVSIVFSMKNGLKMRIKKRNQLTSGND